MTQTDSNSGTWPLVTVVTAVRNNREGIARTLDSILAQTYPRVEVVVIDGASTDGTREVIERYRERIDYFVSEPDKGVYNAQNKGTQHAKGEYCIYMNSGDTFYAADVLEKVFEKDIDADIIYGNWMLVFENGKTRLGTAPEVADIAYFFDDNMCHQSMLIKRNAVLERPYDESFRIYADWEEWLSFVMARKTFQKIDMTICNFMVGGISTGDNASETLKLERKAEIKRINQRYYPDPWKYAMKRVAPIVREYNALKSWVDDGGPSSISRAVVERQFLLEKRKKHNKIIRLLIYISSLLLATNIATILYILCK